ncbi:MAG: sugar phosphate isomerase/epimerase [Acidobacteria bacterium]|nr:sugar phosphate isomerase/epimerase [Acidobacteriota bacterium]
MKHVVSTHVFANHRLTTWWLERIWRAGIPAVEIFCARQHLDYRDPAQIAELRHWFRDSELELHSLHSPMYNDEYWGRSGPQAVISITETEKVRRIAAIDEIKRALEIAELIPYRYLVQHVGVGWEEYDERKIDAAFSALEELSIFARQRGVEVLLENIPNGFSTSQRLRQFIEQTHLHVDFCFDIGHAHICETMESAWTAMQDRIRSTHVHDNDGTNDSHLFPLLAAGGTIDWKRAMELLSSRAEQYPLLLELKESPDMPQPFEAAAQIFERLESLAVGAPAQ